ncbi:WalRK two-component regulatory system regulator WalI [Bacillaceae bacterium]
MDWSRAKTILIVAFLLLDLFLGYQLWLNNGSESLLAQRFQGEKDILEELLQARRIEIAAEIPTDEPQMHHLNVRYTVIPPASLEKLADQEVTLERFFIRSTFKEPPAAPSPFDQGELQNLLAARIWNFSNYRFDPFLSGEGRYTFVQLLDDVPLFSARVEIEVSHGQVRRYRQTYAEVVDTGSGRQVISAFTALRRLIENGMIEDGETVRAVELGYYGHTYDADIQVLAPVWRVVHGRRIHYVNAITGTIEKTSLPDKGETLQ